MDLEKDKGDFKSMDIDRIIYNKGVESVWHLEHLSVSTCKSANYVTISSCADGQKEVNIN